MPKGKGYSKDKIHSNTMPGQKVSKDANPSSGIPASKAKKILKDGTIKGKPLTPDQKKMFGAASSKGKK